jgi:glycosyltransferase involved in cell wall biosynthesis
LKSQSAIMTAEPFVVVNGRAAVREQIGGVERVARELVRRLPLLRPERYRVSQPWPELAHRAGYVWEQLWLPLGARSAELILSPANLAPLASARNVVVIHDVAALRHPEWYSRTYVAWQRAALPRIARRARLVIAPSNFSKAEIVELLGAPESNVVVVPNGVDERFTPDADSQSAREAYGLERPYVLTLGTQITRKNLRALEPAARALAKRGIELVAAGGSRHYMRDIPAVGMRALGYARENHLPGLYAGARAFVLPSLYEGFGIPCFEARACGTPVVAANRTALPETCGDAALLVDPDDPGAIAEAVVHAVTADHDRLAAAGRERAARFSWQRTAREVDAAIAQLRDVTDRRFL